MTYRVHGTASFRTISGKLFYGFLALLCCFIQIPTFAAMAQAPVPEPLTIGTKDYPPLSLPDGTGQLDNLLREAFRRVGREVRFEMLPSQRALSDANDGVLDGDNNRVAGLEKKYSNLIRLQQENMLWDFVAFTKSKGVTVRSWSDLANYSVGYIVGWNILEEKVRAANVVRVASPRQLFNLLAAGRVDVVIYEPHCGKYFLKALGISGVSTQEPPLAREKMYLYLNRKHADLVRPLEDAMRAMRADGSYDRLFSYPTGN